MSLVEPVVEALEGAISTVEEEIREREGQRNHLSNLLKEAQNGVTGQSITAVPAPSSPTRKQDTNFSARGLRHISDIAKALRKRPQTTSRLKEILGVTNVTRYLEELQRQGLARPTGETATNPNNTVRRHSPIWEWIGGDVEVEDPAPSQAGRVQPRTGGRRRRSKGRVRNGTVKKAVEAEVESQGTFTKASICAALDNLRNGSIQHQLRRLEEAGRIEKTGRKVPSPTGQYQVDELRFVAEKVEQAAAPEGASRPVWPFSRD